MRTHMASAARRGPHTGPRAAGWLAGLVARFEGGAELVVKGEAGLGLPDFRKYVSR